jgi:hypothetical protein
MAQKYDLDAMKISELAELFNKITGKQIKKFKDKATGIRRVTEALKEAAPKTTTKAPKAKGEPRARKPFDLPLMDPVTEPREGSKRCAVRDMLKKGATLETVMETIGWDRRTALEGIRLVHKACGYGLTESDKGLIKLVTP